MNSVIPAKSTRPAIENLYLAARDDALELVGTDLEVAIRYRIADDVKIAEPGTTLIPARVASEFIRDLSGETVSLETRDDHCVIQSGVDRCELVTIDTDEFPVVPRFEEEGSLTLQGGTLARLVGRTAFAAAREAGRYAMHGILTQVEDNSLRLVATDGRRLAITHTAVETNGSAPRKAIVPTKGMQLFARTIDDPLVNVRLHFGENQIGLETPKAQVFARLIDGEFPRYAAVIPSTTANSVEADAELMNKKLRLVSNVTASDTRAVRLSFTKDQMDIFARSAGYGEASARMEVAYRGEETGIAFNPDYVMDGLKNCEKDVVQLEFNEKTAPGKFTLGENYIYVVMPITVDT